MSPHEVAALQKKAHLSYREDREASMMSRDHYQVAGLPGRDTATPAGERELSSSRHTVSVTFEQGAEDLEKKRDTSRNESHGINTSSPSGGGDVSWRQLDQRGRESAAVTDESCGENPLVGGAQVGRLSERESGQRNEGGGGRSEGVSGGREEAESGEGEKMEEREVEEEEVERAGEGDREEGGGDWEEGEEEKEAETAFGLAAVHEESAEDLEVTEEDTKAPETSHDNYNLVLYEIQSKPHTHTHTHSSL